MTHAERDDLATPDPSGFDGQGNMRPPHREPAFNISAIVMVLIAVCIGVHVVRALVPVPVDESILISTAFFPIRFHPDVLTLDIPTLVSPISYSFLHGDAVHLAVNMIWLVAFASPLAARIGAIRTLLLWGVSAALAAAAHAALHPGSVIPLVGASGAVSGFMGAAARFGFRADRSRLARGFSGPRLTLRQTFSSPPVAGFLAIWLVLNLLTGTGVMGIGGDRSIAWEAHVGGLLVGLLGMPLFDRR